MTTPGDDNDGLRIGNAERQRAADSLAEHFAAGRIDHTEFEERTGAAWQASTVGELKPLFFDLPGGSLDGYVARDATAGAERSAKAPAVARPAAPDDSRVGRRDRRRNRGDRRADARNSPNVALRIAMATVPIIALILFFVLGAVGFDNAWIAFLLIPLVYMTGGAIARGQRDDEDGRGGEAGEAGDANRNLPRPPNS